MGRGLSRQQVAIIEVLRSHPRPRPDQRSHGLPTTGEIIDALGLERSAQNYASVSRTLARLVERGEVLLWQGELYRAGRGYGYSLRPDA